MLVEIMKINKEEEAVVSSLDVAETFGKEHKNVLKDIRELKCSDEFNRLNFKPIEYTDTMGRKQPMISFSKTACLNWQGRKSMRRG